jgi:hypothetical protein
MATQFVEGQPGTRERLDTRTVGAAGAGSMVEALGAAGAVVLTILGLAGALPLTMMAVATILLGAAILFQGGSIAARYHRLIASSLRGGAERTAGLEVGGGMTAESLAGVAGIVLGILALLGTAAAVAACAVALIAFGAAELFGSAAASRYNAVAVEQLGESETTRRLVNEAVSLSVRGQVFIGVGAVVLGILALLGFAPVTLTLVGLLAIGACLLLSGSAIGARMLGILRHSPAS